MKNVIKEWTNFRLKRFWLLTTIVTYALAGFFVLPVVIKDSLIDLVDRRLDRQLKIDKVYVNPFTFELVITAVTLNDTDDVALMQASSILMNLESSGIFLGALRFREIIVDKPYVYLERFTSGASRLSKLLNDWQLSAQAVTVNETAALPSFLIDSFSIRAGHVRLLDQVRDESVAVSFNPIDVDVLQLSSLPDRVGTQNVKVEIANEALIEWQGSLTVVPFSSAGRLTIQSKLERIQPYLKQVLPIEGLTGESLLTMNYAVSYIDIWDLEIDDLDSVLTNVKVQGLEPMSEFLSFANLSLRGGYVRYPDEAVGFGQITLASPSLGITRLIDGTLNLEQLILSSVGTSANASPSQSMTKSTDDSQWAIAIGSIAIANGELRFVDELTQPNASLIARNIDFEIFDVQNTTHSASRLEGSLQVGEAGAIRVQGFASMLPSVSVDMGVSVEDIAVTIADPYVNSIAEVKLGDGAVSAKFNIALVDSELQVSGSSSISRLSVIDELNNSRLLSWEKLAVDKFEYDNSSSSLHVSSIVIDKPFAKFEIYRDLSTNIENILAVSRSAAINTPEIEVSDPLNMTFTHTAINQATVDFSDKSLPLPFRTVTTNLTGNIGTISSSSSEAAMVTMEGKVDEFGLSRLNGKINLFAPTDSMDLVVEFRNLRMTNLSPYSAAFAGRAIEKGKLNVKLNFVIDEGQLIGKNELLLSDFGFGEKVDSPDAVSLPLDLAVALLTNSAGEIDIELPISGDVNDPEFYVGGVVKEVLKQFLAKVVSAPFRMLGLLIGVEREDFGEVKFLGGRATLSPPEVEQLIDLSKVLAKRPELTLIVPGAYNDRLDVPVLRYQKLVAKALGRLNLGAEDADLMLDDSALKVFETLLLETNPAFDLAMLKAKSVTSSADGNDRLDQVAYIASLRDLIVAAEDVSVDDLVALGRQRQASISAQLRQLGVAEQQIQSGVISAIAFDKNGIDDWMALQLEVGAR